MLYSNADRKIKIGCIADDFTGASDAAAFLTEGGLRTVLFSGIPLSGAAASSCDAVVIALKTRTAETSLAVEVSLRAAEWLHAQGAEKLYVKYCSTFDSTPQGNIGPVLDALLERFQAHYTVLCPALPVNGRTVKDGRLYVNGVPLHQTSMRDHPLTPMWDAEIGKLMEPQSKYCCVTIPGDWLSQSPRSLAERLRVFGQGQEHFYAVPDQEDGGDSERIANAFGNLRILSGGSGLLKALAARAVAGGAAQAPPAAAVAGRCILLAGSCSEMTRKQVAYAEREGVPTLKMDVEGLRAGDKAADELRAFLHNCREQACLIYSSDTPEAVKRVQASGKAELAERIEQTFSDLAVCAVDAGYTRVIVAGGETSGAVAKALGFCSYEIGPSAAPGVPVMIPREQERLRLILKSGNFGQEDFFLRALRMTGEA